GLLPAKRKGPCAHLEHAVDLVAPRAQKVDLIAERIGAGRELRATVDECEEPGTECGLHRVTTSARSSSRRSGGHSRSASSASAATGSPLRRAMRRSVS